MNELKKLQDDLVGLHFFILSNIDTLPKKTLRILLGEHELNCLARFIKNKFSDKRNTKQIKNLIKEVYSL